MIDLAFEGFEEACSCLRLSRFVHGSPAEDYVLICSEAPKVFYFTDCAHMNVITSAVQGDAGEVRERLRNLFASVRSGTPEDLEKEIRRALPGEPERFRVRFEPLLNSIRITLI